MSAPPRTGDAWPAPTLDNAWTDTCATLHMWTQIVGKVRLAQSPPLNHSWNTTLYVTARGLTTSPIPHGSRTFQIDLDFIDHRVVVSTCDGRQAGFALEPQSVAAFHARLFQELERLDLPVEIVATPNEVPDAIPFAEDTVHHAYDHERARSYWRILVQAERVFQQFRARFIGKCSPVHYFWGAPDLAVTRFSGRPAPVHPGGIPNLPDRVTREAYSHEVSSCGFWPGGGAVPYPSFYAYAYPQPDGFEKAPVRPREAFFSPDFREFILPYEAVRSSRNPDATLLEFLQSTYDVAADMGKWDRSALERADSSIS